MTKATLSTNSTRAAVKLINVATKNIGANIHAYAAYMTSAREDGLTISALNRELESLDDANVLPKRATLGIYAQAVDHGDSLALNSATDYAIVFAAISRIRRAKGYDLAATFAPIAELEDINARREAMRVVGTEAGSPIVTRDSSTAAGSAAGSDSDSAPAADSPAAEESATDELVKLLKRATNAFKSGTFTPAEYARLAAALNVLGIAATKAKPVA